MVKELVDRLEREEHVPEDMGVVTW